MARFFLLLALVVLMLISSVAADDSVAHNKNKNKRPKCKARQIYSAEYQKCICNYNAGFGRLPSGYSGAHSYNRNKPINGCVLCSKYNLVADPSGDCVENITPVTGRRLFTEMNW